MRRILVAGSRGLHPTLAEFDDALALLRNGSHEHEKFVVINGTAQGVDTAGQKWGLARKHEIEEYPADWGQYGKSAGYIRNKQMVDSGVDFGIIFWDGESRGTANTMKLLREAHVDHVVVINYG